jgi:hypothetical protein
MTMPKLENSFCKHEPQSYSEYGEYLAEYMNRRLGYYSLPRLSKISFRELVYKLEELGIDRAEGKDKDPFYEFLSQ